MDLYFFYVQSKKLKKKTNVNIEKYKKLIEYLYLNFGKINKKIYKNYKPVNLDLNHTIKHTLNNVDKNI